MKRYSLKDNNKRVIYNYSQFEWNIAWIIVYLIGFITGAVFF